MFSRLLPQPADNTFRGRKPGLWLYAVLLVLFAIMSINSMFNGQMVATSADGIPLASYTPAGAQAIVSFYAIWGATQLVVVLFGFIILIRYRSLVALGCSLLFLEQVLLRVVGYFLPIAKPHGFSMSWFVLLLLLLPLLGLVLSLWHRRAEA